MVVLQTMQKLNKTIRSQFFQDGSIHFLSRNSDAFLPLDTFNFYTLLPINRDLRYEIYIGDSLIRYYIVLPLSRQLSWSCRTLIKPRGEVEEKVETRKTRLTADLLIAETAQQDGCSV